MTDQVQCSTHGECERAFVCVHLLGKSVALGFNRDHPTKEKPFPDAWCDDCEIRRVAHRGWNEESEKSAKISLLCSRCYERARIRNTRTSVTLDDLSQLRWKCGSCEKWHQGPCLDFGYDQPYHWSKKYEVQSGRIGFLRRWAKKRPTTFLNEDYCAIEDRDFFVRGVLHLPIIGTEETFRWGVWGSLSSKNFETLLKADDGSRQAGLPPMFSWLCTQISDYPDTLNLKMYAHIQEAGERPHFELERTDHPLAREYHEGISAERVRELMFGSLGLGRSPE